MDARGFKDLSELTLMDDYMFGVVMQNPALAKAVIECILGVRLRHIEYVEPQKRIKERYEAKAVQLDMYVEDENGSVYNVEIQTTDRRNLPKRMRYYQSNIDLHILSPGVDYRELKKSYVIFICGYDPFGLNRCVYTFENRCLEVPEMALGDETTKVVVNTHGTQVGIRGELLEMLRYLNRGEITGEIARSLDQAVNDVKQNEERRREYMVMKLREMEIREEGLEEGMKKGTQKGHTEGMNLFAALVTKLLSLGRNDDIQRVAADAEYRDKLIKEFQLT